MKNIENITWLRGNMKFISSVNKILCLFYKQQKKIYIKSMYLCIIITVVFDWLAKMIFSHVKNIVFFTCV